MNELERVEMKMGNDNPTHRLTELLDAIAEFDAQMKLLREARAQAEAEVENLVRESGLRDFTNGRYRVRLTQEVVVMDPEALHLVLPELCQKEAKIVYKPDKTALRVMLQSQQAENLKQVARLEERVVVEPEGRRSAKVVHSER
jgi:hypothetical protein